MSKVEFISFILVLLSLSPVIQAQDAVEPVISPDRTGGTVGPAKVDKGVMNLELGANFNTYKKENAKSNGQNYAGILRYGLLENLEVNLGFDFASAAGDDLEKISGFAGFSTGVKIGVAEEDGLLPQVEFEGRIALPWFGREEFRPADAEPNFNFNFANTFSDQWSINYAVGMFWEGAEEAGYYGFMLIHNFNPRLCIFAEHYGFVRGDLNPEPHLGAGIMYMISNKLQLDFSIDLGRDDGAALTFFEVGVATMLKSGN